MDIKVPEVLSPVPDNFLEIEPSIHALSLIYVNLHSLSKVHETTNHFIGELCSLLTL